MNTQVVLITGGLTGIGRATALAFAKEGAQLVVSGRRAEEGQKLVTEIRKNGAEGEFIHADVRREEDVRNLIDKTVERFGRLDVAVNAAGTEGVPGAITEQTADSYAATFDTNVLGTLLSMKHELREASRVRAADQVLDHASRATALEDIEARITELERAANPPARTPKANDFSGHTRGRGNVVLREGPGPGKTTTTTEGRLVQSVRHVEAALA